MQNVHDINILFGLTKEQTSYIYIVYSHILTYITIEKQHVNNNSKIQFHVNTGIPQRFVPDHNFFLLFIIDPGAFCKNTIKPFDLWVIKDRLSTWLGYKHTIICAGLFEKMISYFSIS